MHCWQPRASDWAAGGSRFESQYKKKEDPVILLNCADPDALVPKCLAVDAAC